MPFYDTPSIGIDCYLDENDEPYQFTGFDGELYDWMFVQLVLGKKTSESRTFTKEEIDAFRKVYNEELYRLVFEDTKDEACARKYVEEHPADSEKSLEWNMQQGYAAADLAEIEYRYN